MPLSLVITYAGRAALVNAANTGTASVNIASVGVSATAIVAAAGTVALPGEIKRITAIGGAMVGDDQIHLTITDETADVYSLRSFALYLTDGTLFAAYGQAAPILDKTAGAIMLASLDITLLDAAAIAFTFGGAGFLNPLATTTQVGVVELATTAETQAGVDATRTVTPAGLAAAFATLLGQVWRASNDGAGSGLDADLLAGLPASFYTNIIARLGFTPLNATAYTAADVLAKLLTLDGAGSGVDADLLDGLDSTYFTNIIARLGFTPLNVTAYTAADVRSKLLTVDGAGSGVDADLLDGLDSSYFTNIIARLGFTPLNVTAYTAADVLSKLLTVDGAGTGIDADLLDGIDSSAFARRNQDATFADITASRGDGTGVIYLGVDRYVYWSGATYVMPNGPLVLNGGNVWTSANDGAGSGLDADLLDGFDSGAFERVIASNPTGQGGYIIWASGRKKCWGWIDLAANSAGTWTYPISFDSFAHPKCAAQAIAGNNDQNDNIGIENLPGLSSITIRNAENAALRMWIEMEGV